MTTADKTASGIITADKISTSSILNKPASGGVFNLKVDQLLSIPITFPKTFKIDTSKLKTLEDIIAVIDVINFSVSENNPKIEKIKHLLEEC